MAEKIKLSGIKSFLIGFIPSIIILIICISIALILPFLFDISNIINGRNYGYFLGKTFVLPFLGTIAMGLINLSMKKKWSVWKVSLIYILVIVIIIIYNIINFKTK
jgi:hypothetical protein